MPLYVLIPRELSRIPYRGGFYRLAEYLPECAFDNGSKEILRKCILQCFLHVDLLHFALELLRPLGRFSLRIFQRFLSASMYCFFSLSFSRCCPTSSSVVFFTYCITFSVDLALYIYFKCSSFFVENIFVFVVLILYFLLFVIFFRSFFERSF